MSDNVLPPSGKIVAMTKFVKEEIYRFGIPHNIITYNVSNLSQGDLDEYCSEQGIRLYLASVAHP